METHSNSKGPGVSSNGTGERVGRSVLARYGVAAGSVVAGWLAREALTPAFGQTRLPFTFLYPAVAMAAWYGGLGPGIVATVLGAAAADWFFIDPVRAWPIRSVYDLTALGAFVLSCLFIVGAIEAMHRAKAAALLELRERKRMEQAAAEALQRLNAHRDNSPLAFVEFDAEFRVTGWSAGAERLFGWSAEEVLGKHIRELRWLYDVDENAVAGISADMLDGRRLRDVHVNRNYRKDGSVIECEWYNSAIVDAEGKLVSVNSKILDITERKRAQRDLNESAERAAADLQAMTILHRVGARCARATNGFEECVGEILEAAIALTGAERGNVQLLHGQDSLKIAAQRGFEDPFLKFFATVGGGSGSACGRALVSAEQVIIEDVSQSEVFAGQEALEVLLEAGVRAVHSTRLVSSSGTVLGVISTHFGQPHLPSQRELRLMDLLARQAADYLERRRIERALQEAHTKLGDRAVHLEGLVEERTGKLREMMAELEQVSYAIVHDMRAPLRAMRAFADILANDGADASPALRRE